MRKIQSVLALILFLSLGALLVFLPSFTLGLTELYNEKRIAQGLVLFIGAIFFYILLAQNKLQIGKRNFVLGSLLLILLSISTIFSNYPAWALLEIGWYICLIQLSLVLAFLYQKDPVRFERLFLLVVISMCALYSIRVLGDIVTSLIRDDWPVWPHRSRFTVTMGDETLIPEGFLGFQNFRYFNHIQTWTLPILVYAIFHFSKDSEKYLRHFIGGLLSVWFMIAFASGTRGTLFAIVLSLLLIVVLFKKENYKRWFIVCFVTACAGLFIYYIVFQLIISTGSGKPLARYGSSNRYDLWMVALEKIISNPLLGVGPMHLADLKGENPLTSPHNIYLMWAAEWGIPAFLVFIYAVFENIKKWIKQTVSHPSSKKISITIALSAGLIHSGASGLMITPLSQLLVAVLLGWMIGVYFTGADELIFSRRNYSYRLKYHFILLILLINVLVFIKFGDGITQLGKDKERFQILLSNDEINVFPITSNFTNANIFPRFWEQGFIGLEDEEDKLILFFSWFTRSDIRFGFFLTGYFKYEQKNND